MNQNIEPWYTRWYVLLLIPIFLVLSWFSMRVFMFDWFRFTSGSMLPTIQQGNTLITQKLGCGNYELFGIPIAKTSPSTACQPEHGDLYVFQSLKKPRNSYVMRVIGLPGDQIEYDGVILKINGQTITQATSETYSWTDTKTHKTFKFQVLRETMANQQYPVLSLMNSGRPPHMSGEWTVPAGQYFLLGDNRDMANDSRYWGFLPQEKLIGKVVSILGQ